MIAWANRGACYPQDIAWKPWADIAWTTTCVSWGMVAIALRWKSLTRASATITPVRHLFSSQYVRTIGEVTVGEQTISRSRMGETETSGRESGDETGRKTADGREHSTLR